MNMFSNGITREFLVNVVAPGVMCHRRVRNSIYRWYGAELAHGCGIKPGCYLGNGTGVLKIGGVLS